MRARERILDWFIGTKSPGGPSALTDVQVGRRFAVRLGIVIAVALVGVFVLVPLVLLAFDVDLSGDDAARARPPLWRVVTSLLLTLVALVIMVVNTVKMIRSGAFGAALRNPLRSMPRRDRRAAMRQIRGQIGVDPETLSTTMRVARVVADTAYLRSMLGLAFLGVAQLVREPGSWLNILWAAGLVIGAVGAVLITRDARAARSFLRTYG